MGIHNFSSNTGNISQDIYNSILASNRSDVEQRNSPLAIYDTESADIRMARRQAKELIDISGADVEIFLRTENADYDNVWDEDADPTYWNPFSIKGYFKPQPLEAELKQWGAEIINKTEITFDYFELKHIIGDRMLRTGDVIKLPYNTVTQSINPRNFRILNATPTGNFRYTWLYMTCQLETLSADITVRPEQDMPDEEGIKTNGQYRESI